jgi:alpha-galactosidase
VSSGLAAAGYKYVNIDDCWLNRERNAAGQQVPATDRFPSGMKALADYGIDTASRSGATFSHSNLFLFM